MKKILGLGIVAILVMAMVGGGTWAYFSDTEATTDNILVAGTLDLGLANTPGTDPTAGTTGTWTVNIDSWAPGDNWSGTLYVQNSGTIDMTSVNATFSYVYDENTPTTVDDYSNTTDTDNLTQMITANTATWNSVSVPAIATKKIDELASAGSINLGTLAANTEVPFTIDWLFSTAATNGCQGDNVTLTITLTGTQS